MFPVIASLFSLTVISTVFAYFWYRMSFFFQVPRLFSMREVIISCSAIMFGVIMSAILATIYDAPLSVLPWYILPLSVLAGGLLGFLYAKLKSRKDMDVYVNEELERKRAYLQELAHESYKSFQELHESIIVEAIKASTIFGEKVSGAVRFYATEAEALHLRLIKEMQSRFDQINAAVAEDRILEQHFTIEKQITNRYFEGTKEILRKAGGKDRSEFLS